MPSIGHVAVGLAVARGVPRPERLRPIAWAATCVALADLPDLDVLAFRLGIPYGAPWGHRGAVHSLAFAALCTLAVALLARADRLPVGRVALAAGLALGSHGVLDTLTDGGMGIALLWPFTARRLFAPWQPIPVAPIGRAVLGAHGLAVMAREALMFSPLFVYALWPRGRARAEAAAAPGREA